MKMLRLAVFAGGAIALVARPRRLVVRTKEAVRMESSSSPSASELFDVSRAVLALEATEVIDDVTFTRYYTTTKNGQDVEPPALKTEPVLYVPGIEFRGISSGAQLEGLVASGFEPWLVSVGGEDRSSFAALSGAVQKKLELWTREGSRPIIVAESFGALLALDVATRLSEERRAVYDALRGFVLINPATSYDASFWSTFSAGRVIVSAPGDGAYAAAVGAAVGLLASDASMVDKTIADFRRLDFSSLGAAVDGAGALAKLVPPATLQWRIDNWLDAACGSVNDRLWRLRKEKKKKNQNVGLTTTTTTTPGFVLVAGDADNFLPSRNEVARLARELPGARTEVVILPRGGHAPLVDPSRMKLAAMLRDSEVLFAAEKREASLRRAQGSVDAFVPPNATEVAETRRTLVDPLRRLTSPVFLSRAAPEKRVERGLGAIRLPSQSKRPLLLVGNHQLFGLDLPLLIDEFLRNCNGTVIRGLAHPVAVEAPALAAARSLTTAASAAASSSSSKRATARRAESAWWADAQPTRGPQTNFGGGGGDTSSFFARFGAVEVSPRNFVRLMQRNETVLLFPGGVRESNHGKNEAYKLFWPQDSEFVRVAAKFDADIVAFGAIGAADSFEILRDRDDPLPTLGFGEAARQRKIPSARKWANDTSEDFRFPLAVPSPRGPARQYFYFAPPFSTVDVDPRDRNACAAVYATVKGDVEAAIAALLKARERDPFRSPLPRLAYEAALGQAPTFDIVDADFDHNKKVPATRLARRSTPAQPDD